MTGDIRIVPANQGSCEDLQTVFGARGSAAICQCQRFKLAPREAFKSYPIAERRRRIEEQTNCGRRSATTTSGLVAYLDREPVGWCAVEPRPAYEGLLRVYRVPWEGRREDKIDESVWAVTCVFSRAGFRRRGIGYALARPCEDITWGELHMGTRSMFAAAGFDEVNRPSPRRAVMRIDFDDQPQQHHEERDG